VALPNVGNEGHSYLHHMLTRYDSLAPLTLFLPDTLWNDATRAKPHFAHDVVVRCGARAAAPPARARRAPARLPDRAAAASRVTRGAPPGGHPARAGAAGVCGHAPAGFAAARFL
jgi:hypothetical protein